MNPYNYFDRIVCINLDIRKDKRNYISDLFKRLNIPFEFYIAKKSKNGGAYGCFESHINVITKAYQDGLNNILIFEDDVVPTSYYNHQELNKCIEFMKTNNDWHLFYLGYCAPMLYQKKWKEEIYKIFYPKKYDKNIFIGNPLCCHSYVVNKNGMKNIINKSKYYLDNPDKISQIDSFMNLRIKNGFFYKHILFRQKTCLGSDNNYKIFNIDITKNVTNFRCVVSDILSIDLFVYSLHQYINVILVILVLLFIIKIKKVIKR